MRRNWDAIWLVARREFQDQFRDWRIVVPMFLMVAIFPFVADNTTRQAVNFMNRFGGDLILDRLVEAERAARGDRAGALLHVARPYAEPLQGGGFSPC